MGGSLMRIHRDVRFSPNKKPYKTNVGIQFRHRTGHDVHAPCFYVHLARDECFLAVGIWHPETAELYKIRAHIAKEIRAWFAARDDKGFIRHFALSGESNVRVPRGFAADHPAGDDLKRRDFISVCGLTPSQAAAAGQPPFFCCHSFHEISLRGTQHRAIGRV